MRRKRKYSWSRWQIERERCHISARRPTDAVDGSVPISDQIPDVMRSLGLDRELWLKKLEEEWVSLVGEPVARHARPGRYEKGRLSVFVDSAVWLNELKRYGQKEMLQKLRERFGADRIAKLWLEPDPGS